MASSSSLRSSCSFPNLLLWLLNLSLLALAAAVAVVAAAAVDGGVALVHELLLGQHPAEQLVVVVLEMLERRVLLLQRPLLPREVAVERVERPHRRPEVVPPAVRRRGHRIHRPNPCRLRLQARRTR